MARHAIASSWRRTHPGPPPGCTPIWRCCSRRPARPARPSSSGSRAATCSPTQPASPTTSTSAPPTSGSPPCRCTTATGSRSCTATCWSGPRSCSAASLWRTPASGGWQSGPASPGWPACRTRSHCSTPPTSAGRGFLGCRHCAT
nr:hypothetical protein [Actinomycetes bacterium]